MDSWLSDFIKPIEENFYDLRFVHTEITVPDKTNDLPLISIDFLIDENI